MFLDNNNIGLNVIKYVSSNKELRMPETVFNVFTAQTRYYLFTVRTIIHIYVIIYFNFYWPAG
jgi:hypothetical protein